jgi:ribosome-associated protein
MDIIIPFHELEFTYARSRGPGGQNVNRTNSAAILRWNLQRSQAFSEAVKLRLATNLAGQLTDAGDILIRSDEHRDQDQNRSSCINKLQIIFKKALFVPKRRVATKPKRSAVRRRLDSKKHLSENKLLRKKVAP